MPNFKSRTPWFCGEAQRQSWHHSSLYLPFFFPSFLVFSLSSFSFFLSFFLSSFLSEPLKSYGLNYDLFDYMHSGRREVGAGKLSRRHLSGRKASICHWKKFTGKKIDLKRKIVTRKKIVTWKFFCHMKKKVSSLEKKVTWKEKKQWDDFICSWARAVMRECQFHVKNA